VPRSEEAARAAIAIAVEEGVPILPRGAGSSQCGQAVGEALVIDHTKVFEPGAAGRSEIRRAIVQPGIVLDYPERPASQAWPLVPGGRFDQRSGHDRRHDRQQLLRLALDRVRQHGPQRPRHRRRYDGRRALALRADGARIFRARMASSSPG
jgi:FAD/FMN-containing dehydrogenase